jgi:hypothetical protein
MRVVPADGSAVESALLAGRLRCPACRDPLRPWGTARPRTVRIGGSRTRSVRPRRARCTGCRTTHVLLPDWMLARRADAAPVVWSALAAHARGVGYRRIALRLRLPETTVRGWLRAFRRTAPRLLGALTRGTLPGGPAGAPAAAAAVERAAGTMPAWRLAVLVSGARLLSNTNPPQHAGPSALRPGARVRSALRGHLTTGPAGAGSLVTRGEAGAWRRRRSESPGSAR